MLNVEIVLDCTIGINWINPHETWAQSMENIAFECKIYVIVFLFKQFSASFFPHLLKSKIIFDFFTEFSKFAIFSTRIECWWIQQLLHFQFSYQVWWNFQIIDRLSVPLKPLRRMRWRIYLCLYIDLFNSMFYNKLLLITAYWKNQRASKRASERAHAIQTSNATKYLYFSITRWHLIQIFFIKIRNNMNKFDYADVMPILDESTMCTANGTTIKNGAWNDGVSEQARLSKRESKWAQMVTQAHRTKWKQPSHFINNRETHSVRKSSYKRAIRMEKKNWRYVCEK